MKLLRVIRSTDPATGGPIEGLLRSSEVLLRDGHEVEVVSLESEDDAARHQLPFPVTALGAGWGKYGYNSKLAPWIKENARRFDAVVLHGLWNYSSYGAWRGLRHQSIPYFIFSHGMMDPWFRTHYPLKHAAKLAYWWIGEGRALRDASAVLFTSEEERFRARRVFYGHAYKERVVRYGVSGPAGDLHSAKEALFRTFPALEGRRILLFLSRIHPKKGCDLLIQAFAKSLNRIAPDVDLVLAGPDQVNWEAELQSLAMELGVGSRIHWLGMLTGDLKWGAFHSADAMILPSHQENFGIVVAEAMACSTPVLISNKVNIWREVEASRGGFVQPDTEEGTENLIVKFCALSAEDRAQMGTAARRAFLQYFDAESAAHDFAQVIGFAPPSEAAASRRKMKVLQVIRDTRPESGGPIEALIRTSEALLREGHEVEVVSLETEETAAGRSFPFPIVALGSGLTKYGYNFRLAPWMRQNADRFDAAILHGLWNYSSFGAWRGLRRQAVPYFIFSHGMMDPWFRARYPLKHISKLVYWWLVEGRALRDAAGVLFTCEEERVRAQRVFYGHGYRERVVRFGTADPGNRDGKTDRFLAAFPALDRRRFLLFMSRIHPKKGCDLLLQAFAEIAASRREDLDLVIAGPDQIGWTAALKAQAAKLGIGKRVHWTGMLRGDVKWDAFRAADALILPSHQENFGFVVAEAMACSTPVLISDQVNIWREVQQAAAGFVEPDTLEGTRNLIRRYLALSPENLLKMRKAARDGFLNHFDVEGTAADLVQLIWSVREQRQ
jgi:glycosyltransferase involved in cell wall biosynthesis